MSTKKFEILFEKINSGKFILNKSGQVFLVIQSKDSPKIKAYNLNASYLETLKPNSSNLDLKSEFLIAEIPSDNNVTVECCLIVNENTLFFYGSNQMIISDKTNLKQIKIDYELSTVINISETNNFIGVISNKVNTKKLVYLTYDANTKSIKEMCQSKEDYIYIRILKEKFLAIDNTNQLKIFNLNFSDSLIFSEKNISYKIQLSSKDSVIFCDAFFDSKYLFVTSKRNMLTVFKLDDREPFQPLYELDLGFMPISYISNEKYLIFGDSRRIFTFGLNDFEATPTEISDNKYPSDIKWNWFKWIKLILEFFLEIIKGTSLYTRELSN